MALLTLPKNPGVDALRDAVLALDARLVALETDHAALREELRTRRTAARLEELEGKAVEAFADVAQNVRAIRAIFTLLHPDDEHPVITDDVVANGVWLHDLVMYWLATYEGRIPVGEVG